MRQLLPAAVRLTLCLAAARAAAAQATPPAVRPAGGPGGAPGGAPGGRPAQPPPSGTAEVRGVAVDAAGGPVSSVTIAVRSRRDSALVAGALAGADGRFRVQGLAPGAYVLRTARLGYAPRLRAFTVSEPGQRVDLDTVQLTRVAATLSEVSVGASAAAMTVEPDRNSYRAKDVAPGAANASEVLEVVPSVQVDADGKVSLRGNENVVVQINGRPTPLRGQQLAAFLKQLPGPVVERVEVVPSPSAKYDPEGLGGIINIVLKQDADLGTSGGVTVQGMNAGRWNGSGNVGHQQGRATLFASYGFNIDERAFSGINDRERYGPARVFSSATDQDLTGTTLNRGHNVTANFDWRPTRRDVLSQAAVVNVRASGEDSRLAFTEFDASHAVSDRYLRPRGTHARGLLLDYTAAWKRTIAPRKHELNAEVRVNRTRDEEDNLFTRRSADGRTLLDGEANDVDARATQLTPQLDYTRPLGKASKLETGYRGNSRWLDREFDARRDDQGSGTWAASPLSNRFSFDEHVQAAYGVVTRTARKFELQGGLRAEYTARTFALAAERYPYDYFSLFPSAALSYGGSGATQTRLSYSRRIRRPGTQELNPFPQFFDVQNVFVGNPQLRPEFTDAVELGITRTGKLGTAQLSPFFRRTTDIIRVDIDPDAVVDGRAVTTVSFVNLATSNSFGTDFNTTLRAGKRLTAISNVNVFRLVTDGGSASALGSDAVAWSTRFNTTFQATPALALQAIYFYRSPMGIEQGRFAAFQMTTFVLRQKVYGDRGTLSLRVLDPFNTNRFAVRAGTDQMLQITQRRPGVRGVFLGFQYATGQAPRLRTPRQDQQAPAAAPGFGGP
jgi:outer membrane receptor protein involved in Fe transport